MPNLLGSVKEEDFTELERFCLWYTYTDRPYSIEHTTFEIVEQAFKLAIALDMAKIIKYYIDNFDNLFQKYITKLDVFSACCDYGIPFDLLNKLLHSKNIDIYLFGLSKIREVVKKEKELQNPSNKLLYMIYNDATINYFFLEKKFKCPILYDSYIKAPKSTFEDFKKWIGIIGSLGNTHSSFWDITHPSFTWLASGEDQLSILWINTNNCRETLLVHPIVDDKCFVLTDVKDIHDVFISIYTGF